MALHAESLRNAPADSPQVLQEDFSPPKSHLPKDNLHFALDFLSRNPMEFFWEGEQLRTDFFRAGLEAVDTFFSPVYLGENMPKGRGNLVIGPGFMMPAAAYILPEKIFSRLGYDVHVYKPKWGVNVVPIEHQLEHFGEWIDKIDGKIIFLAHSKSGLLGLAMYALMRDYVLHKFEHIVSLGAPRPTDVNFGIGIGYLGTQLLLGGDDFRLAHETLDKVDIHNIDGIFWTSIGAYYDSVIKGEYTGSNEQQAMFHSSHSGLVWHKQVIPFVANRLDESRSIDSEAA